MKKTHHVIIVPGLSGSSPLLEWWMQRWESFGFTIHIFEPHWYHKQEHFQPKLKKLVTLIDALSNKNAYVSLLGISAGGSAIINAFAERKSKIHRVINLCGRLRAGENVFPSLDIAASRSQSFKESVLLCEQKQKTFSPKDLAKIMTVRPLWDETVPLSSSDLKGATNIQIISIEHMLSICLALTIYKKPLIDFLKTAE